MSTLANPQPYRLPSHIEAVVDVVVGVSDFPPLAPKPNRKHRHMIRDSITTTAAAAVVNGASDKAPVKPVIGLMYASDTTVTLMTLQLCWFPNATAPSLSNTTTPCDNTLSPITHYEADLYVVLLLVVATFVVSTTRPHPLFCWRCFIFIFMAGGWMASKSTLLSWSLSATCLPRCSLD